MTDNLNKIFVENKHYIEKLKEKLRGKKVILYGTGKFFKLLKSNDVFENLDVIGVCDKKYLPEDEERKEFGYNVIALEHLTSHKTAYILITTLEPLSVIRALKRLNIEKTIPIIKITAWKSLKFHIKTFFKKTFRARNNTFVYIKTNGKKIYNPKIKNLKVKFVGSNNYIEIQGPILIKEKMYISCINDCKIIINNHNRYRKMKIYAGHNSTVEIGSGTTAEDVIIMLKESQGNRVIIGKNCMLSYGVFIRTDDSHTIYNTTTKQVINVSKDVEIGNHVWLASNCQILKGSAIPSNCVVGTNSVVTKAFNEENCVIAGNPAKVVKRDINWDRRNNRNFPT